MVPRRLVCVGGVSPLARLNRCVAGLRCVGGSTRPRSQFGSSGSSAFTLNQSTFNLIYTGLAQNATRWLNVGAIGE
jgi:hypothetical protein